MQFEEEATTENELVFSMIVKKCLILQFYFLYFLTF